MMKKKKKKKHALRWMGRKKDVTINLKQAIRLVQNQDFHALKPKHEEKKKGGGINNNITLEKGMASSFFYLFPPYSMLFLCFFFLCMLYVEELYVPVFDHRPFTSTINVQCQRCVAMSRAVQW